MMINMFMLAVSTGALNSDFNLIFILRGWVFLVTYCCRYIYFNFSLLLEEKSFAMKRTYSLDI